MSAHPTPGLRCGPYVMSMQGLRCFPLFLVRIVMQTILAIAYAASYANQGFTVTAAAERAFIFILVTGFLPLITLSSLPIYFNSWKARAS